MSNPTTPFSWQMPTATDLVTDLPADFEVFGQAVATSMADLLGGTSGQILAKNSNTDMDFVWIANDQGDITGITATSPLTGGGSSGAVSVGIQDGTTAQKGAVQLENSTSSTSTTTAAVPASVKTSYDLAAAAIPKSTVTTNGDIIYATGSAAVTRLGIGSAGQVLTVASGVPSWAAAGGASGPTFRATRITTDYTIPSANTFTKMPFNGEDWDTGGCYDSTTNFRFTPTTAGYYEINGNCNLLVDAPVGRIIYSVYRNGSAWARFYDGLPPASSFNITSSVQMYFNGSTDYAEMYIWTASSTTRTMPLTVSYLGNTFDGVWIRS